MAIEASTVNVDVARDFEQALEDRAPGGAALREEWDQLLASATSNVVFLTWQWQLTWWRHFGPQNGSQLRLLTVRSRSGELMGIAPLYIGNEPVSPPKEYVPGEGRPEPYGERRRVVRFIGGTEVADYLDVIAPADKLHDVWSAVLDCLLDCHSDWDVIDLHSLPQWSPSREMLPQIAQEKGLSCAVMPEDVCPVVSLPGDFETYLMSLRKKDRHELRRKVRKLEGREDVRWYLVPPTDAEQMHDAMHTFLDLHRKSGTDKAHFMNEDMASFFFETVEALLPTGWLDLAILEVDKEPAAAYFSFNYNERIYLYNSGYDPRFSSYSAGIALLVYRIHKAILQGAKHFDFLRGDEEYKYDFGGKNSYVFRAIIE
jgi:CelD/BcsL family acetyltransferase involved in cellulose biosynthesis